MYYINPNGINKGVIMCQPFPGRVSLPDEYLTKYLDAKGFVNIVVNDDNEVIELSINQEALDDYEAKHQPDISVLKTEKLEEISKACHNSIVKGVDVTLSDNNSYHFSLEETDQINLSTAYQAVSQGKEEYPYHADGELSKMYSAKDIIMIYEAATKHKLYHITYCNHVREWVKLVDTVDELNEIVYGAELPKDLYDNMQKILNDTSVK